MRAPLLSRSHRRRRRGVDYPIEIEFDGDEVNFFEGGWSEAGGNVLNDQISLGSEEITNPDLEGVYVGGMAPNWSEFGAGTPAEENVIIHAGSSSQKLTRVANNDRIISSNAGVIVGQWYFSTAWLFSDQASLSKVKFAGGRTTGTADYFFQNMITAGVFTQVKASFRAGTNTMFYLGMWLNDAGTIGYIDDTSTKPLVFTSLINSLKSRFGLADGFFIDVYINAVTVDNPVGVIWNYDGSNNFGMAYMDGENLVVDKNVAGTYSNLASVAQAVTQDQILRIENPAGTNVLNILYNGVSKATPTIADAGIILNTGIALFSTEANNAISKVVIGKL